MLAVSRRHKQKYNTPAPSPVAIQSDYAIRVAQCRHDDAHLRNTYSEHTERNRFKIGVLKGQRDYLNKLLANPTINTGDNEVVGWCVIWAADIQDWGLLLDLALYCSTRPISLPRSIKRTPAIFAADSAFQTLEPLLKMGTASPAQREVWMAFYDAINTDRLTVIYPLAAKYYKLRAQLFERDHDLKNALICYKKAQSLSDSIGCKGRIDELGKTLTTTPLADAQASATLAASSPTTHPPIIGDQSDNEADDVVFSGDKHD